MYDEVTFTDVLGFIQTQGWNYKEAGNQFVTEICPYCGKDKFHFYIQQEKGLFDCKICGVSGNLWELKKDFGSTVLTSISTIVPKKEEVYPKKEEMRLHREAFKTNELVQDYLMERGILPEMWVKFRLGLTPDNKLAIPIIRNKQLVNIKYRSIPPASKFYMREKGCPSYLFNGDAIEADNSIILTEGELDAIVATQLGFRAVSGITGASSGLVAEEMKQLDRAKKVIVIYDSDEPGQAGAKKVIDRIGIERCFNIVLEQKDLNEFLLSGGTRETLEQLITDSQNTRPEAVFSFSEIIDEINRDRGLTGLQTGYKALDNVFSGLGPGKLTIVAADTRVGKSTFCNNIFKNLALQGIPVLVFSLENQPVETAKRISTMLTGKRYNDISLVEFEEIKKQFSELPFYFYFAGDKDTDVQTIRQVTGAAKKYYGVQAILIDHMQFFGRSITHQAQELSRLTIQLKRLAVGFGMPVMAISHISRKENSQQNRIPTIHDLKGSSSIEQDADQVLVLWRNLSPVDQPELMSDFDSSEYEKKQSEMLVRIHKDRNGCGYGDFWMHYDLVTGNITEEIK